MSDAVFRAGGQQLCHATLIACVAGLATASSAFAQWRENSPAVVSPPPKPVVVKPDDTAVFPKRYVDAGSPRMVVFWNRSFDDQLTTTRERFDIETKSSSRQDNSLEKTTNGDAGAATLRDGDESATATTTRRKFDKTVDTAQRATPLSERNYTQLQIAFEQEIRAAGARLLDRAMLMRSSQVESNSDPTNSKRIEAEALVGKSDLLVEIVLIPDTNTPLGSGFKVAVKKPKSGEVVFSAYTAATPLVAAGPGRYVATDSGFEWKSGSVPPITVADVGKRLAEEIMMGLGSTL